MKNPKNLLTIALIVLGTATLLFGLAKLGSRSPAGPTTDLTKPVMVEDHIKGPTNAPVTLVEYSDFQCPACRTFEPTLKRLLADYDEELRLVYRHYPLRAIHRHAEAAASAAEAAGLQGKFWEYHDVLFNTQDNWSKENNPKNLFLEYAKSLGLNEEQFKRDLNGEAVKNKVADDASSGDEANVSATPTFFLNGKRLDTPKTYEGFGAAVVEQLILTGNNNVNTSTGR